MKSLVIMTNSPGEVAAWVKPVVGNFHERYPGVPITVVIPPCTFASGREADVLSQMPGIHQILTPRHYLRYMMSGILPPGFRNIEKGSGVVIHLGGDFVHTGLLAKRLHMPAVAYTEGLVTWKTPYAAFCVPYPAVRDQVHRKGVPIGKIHLTGNLMLDAIPVEFDRKRFLDALGWVDGESGRYILLVPGSRPYELARVAPLFVEAASLLRDTLSDYRFIMALSPFASPELLQEALPGGSIKRELDDVWTLTTGPEWKRFEIKVVQGRQYEAMRLSSFALTIPGTNTAEMAYLEIPMLVNVPLNWPQDIPLEGLPGLVGKLPYLGPWIKGLAVRKLGGKIRFTALPNRIAEREIVPELRGILDARLIASKTQDLVKDRGGLERSVNDAKAVMGPTGAAENLVDVVTRFADFW